MTTLTHFDTPISEPINAQIMQLVVDHLSDISAMEIAPSNLLYSIYQYAIGLKCTCSCKHSTAQKALR